MEGVVQVLTEIPQNTAVFLPKRIRNHCQKGIVRDAASCDRKDKK